MKTSVLLLIIACIPSACGHPRVAAGSGRIDSAAASAPASAEQPLDDPPVARVRPPLTIRAELDAAAVAVANTGLVSSQFVGAAGAESAPFIVAASLLAMATDDELIALLEHPSPIVRAYVGGHLAEQQPASYRSLVAAVNDRGAIESMSGCSSSWETVAAHVVRGLCGVYESDGEHSAAAKQLIEEATAGGDARARAVASECLEEYRQMRAAP